MEEKELSINELDNTFGGISREASTDKALEHPEQYRQQLIEELKRQRETITSSEEYNSQSIKR